MAFWFDQPITSHRPRRRCRPSSARPAEESCAIVRGILDLVPPPGPRTAPRRSLRSATVPHAHDTIVLGLRLRSDKYHTRLAQLWSFVAHILANVTEASQNYTSYL